MVKKIFMHKAVIGILVIYIQIYIFVQIKSGYLGKINNAFFV